MPIYEIRFLSCNRIFELFSLSQSNTLGFTSPGVRP
jgi:hypothetical protein